MRSKSLQIRLTKLYRECNSIHEFLVRKDLAIPEASKLDVLACIVYYFKKNNKFIHDSIIAMFFLASLVGGMLISYFAVGQLILVGFLTGLCFFEIVGTLISIALFDMMHILEWHERGFPIEY